jgi:hypothetical protein
MCGSWNISVGDRAMGLTTEESGFDFEQRQEIFLFSWLWNPSCLVFNRYLGYFIRYKVGGA